tara:strand:+ start:1550 stop:2074 length:525 start_codon:yes stop_codon:yes gene_type:complete
LKKKLKKIGILGGTFDPAHIGHLKISTLAKKKFKLNDIIWAITKKNPFKKKGSNNLNKRIKLANKVIKGKSFIKIRFYEDKIKSNKTYHLIKFLKKKYKRDEIFFLMGADNLINFHRWYKWREISSMCKILVFDRHGYKLKSLKSLSFKRLSKYRLKFINFNKVNISSSKLRKI